MPQDETVRLTVQVPAWMRNAVKAEAGRCNENPSETIVRLLKSAGVKRPAQSRKGGAK